MSPNDREKEDTNVYKAVVNEEEQYSIWLDYKEIPRGWRHAGRTGSKQECLDYIKEVWTDMRPLSLRKKMEEFARNPPPPAPPPDPNAVIEERLVDRLCAGEHEVEVGLRPERSVKLFKAAVDRNYVHIKFTGTRGGTELGVRLDPNACEFSHADFECGVGTAYMEGTLKLDYVEVRCIATIDLSTLEGRGRLVRVEGKEQDAA